MSLSIIARLWDEVFIYAAGLWKATIAQLHSDSCLVAECGYSLGQVLHVMKTSYI
jgi:hypothetical protein